MLASLDRLRERGRNGGLSTSMWHVISNLLRICDNAHIGLAEMPQDSSPIHPARVHDGMAYMPEDNSLSVVESLAFKQEEPEYFYLLGLLRELGHYHRHKNRDFGDGAAWDWAAKYIASLPHTVRIDNAIVRIEDRVLRELDFARVEERYYFYRLSDHDLEHAKFALERVMKVEDKFLQHALMKDAVLSYARPFSKSRGYFGKKYALPEKYVPAAQKELHRRLMFYRDQVFAHTDIASKTPQLSRFKTDKGFWYPMSFKSLSPEDLLSSVPEIELLVSAVMERNIVAMSDIQTKVFDMLPYNPRRAEQE